MSDVQIDFVGSAEQLLGEYQKTHRENERLKKGLQEVKSNSREAAREQRQMAREAKAAFESTRTPLEKHNAQLSRLGELLRKGHLDQETYSRSVQRVNRVLRDNQMAEQERARSLTTSARVTRGMVSQIGEVAVAYGIATRVIGMFVDANRRAIESADTAAEKFHAVGRRFRIQSGLRGLEADAAQGRIEQIAQDRAVPLDIAGDIATQMVSSEFSAAQASGGAFDEFLMLSNALSAAGESSNPAEDTKALAMFLQSQGLQKNRASVRRIGRTSFAAAQSGQFNMQALSELAGVGAALQPLMSPEEQIAAMGTLVDVMPAAEAATGLRNVMGRLASAGTSASRVGALEQIGLTDRDVNPALHGFGPVMERLGGALEGAAPEDRTGILKQLFGEKAMVAGRVLITQREKTERLRRTTLDDEAFRDVVATAESGPDRGAVRQQVARETLQRREARNDALIGGELDLQLHQAGVSPFRRDLAGAAYRATRYLGGSPQVALQAGSFLGPEAAGLVEGRAGLRQLSPLAGEQNQGQVDRWTAAINQNNQLLQQNNEEMRRENNGGGGAGQMPERQLGRTN